MKRRLVILFVCILSFTIFFSACSSGPSGPQPASSLTQTSTAPLDAATQVQERCSKCHPLTRVESTRHSAAEWKTIVDLMISRGAQLTPEEETVVVDYLATNFGK